MISEQLQLELKDAQLPWNGRSPRSLCRVNVERSLASEGTGRVIPDGPSVQLQLLEEDPFNGS